LLWLIKTGYMHTHVYIGVSVIDGIFITLFSSSIFCN
jgi:hypothetical protein